MRLSKAAILVCGLFISAIAYAQPDPTNDPPGVFTKVDKEAAFPGGEQAWRQFLGKNLNPETPVKNGAPMGKYTVMIQFVVDTAGRVSDIKPLTKMGYGMEQEVVRLLKTSGLWTPAVLDQKPVVAFRKQPVTFMVEAEDLTITSDEPYVLFTDTDNEITLEIDKVKTEDLIVTVAGGTVKSAGNKFIVRVHRPGRAILYISNKKKSKDHWEVSFEVRQKN